MTTQPINKVSVVGLGYIGLPTAALLASRGLEVVGIDVDSLAIDTINQGNIHIIEPDLDMVVRAAVNTGRLRAQTAPEAADVFILAVPTPFTDGHKPDISFIKAAAETIAPVLETGNLVLLESTSPVGTTEQLCQWLAEQRPDLSFPHTHADAADIRVAHCPERVLPGQVLRELIDNGRIIGGISKSCAQAAESLYRTFVSGTLFTTNARTAELAKLVENAFRDVNIAFANELSVICEQLNINVWELIGLANQHPRVNILKPGPGVGGHCIAVDPWFIVDSVGQDTAQLIYTARMTNDQKPNRVVAKVVAAAERFKKPKIACLGLSYKADIDDLRESPAVEIVAKLAEREVGELYVVEPHIDALPKTLSGACPVKLTSLQDALAQCYIVVVLVDHSPFYDLDPMALKEKVLIDTRGVF